MLMNGKIVAAAFATFLALALGGCDSPEPAAPKQERIKIANPHHEGLAKLSEPMRHLALMRAIRDTGHRCKRVESGAHQQEHEDLQMWVARCEDRRLWAVFIGANANIQVRNCADAQRLGLPPCRAPST